MSPVDTRSGYSQTCRTVRRSLRGRWRDLPRCQTRYTAGLLTLAADGGRLTQAAWRSHGTNRLSYARFMVDWVVLAPARWALRKAVRIVNLVLNQLKVWQHPDKTLVGCVSRGFDFLGYHLTTERLPAARKTKQNHINHVNRLYEQRATSERIDGCVKRWKKWTRSGHGKVAQWSDRDRHGGTWESRYVEHPHRRYRSWRAIPRPHV